MSRGMLIRDYIQRPTTHVETPFTIVGVRIALFALGLSVSHIVITGAATQTNLTHHSCDEPIKN